MGRREEERERVRKVVGRRKKRVRKVRVEGEKGGRVRGEGQRWKGEGGCEGVCEMVRWGRSCEGGEWREC